MTGRAETAKLAPTNDQATKPELVTLDERLAEGRAEHMQANVDIEQICMSAV